MRTIIVYDLRNPDPIQPQEMTEAEFKRRYPNEEIIDLSGGTLPLPEAEQDHEEKEREAHNG